MKVRILPRVTSRGMRYVVQVDTFLRTRFIVCSGIYDGAKPREFESSAEAAAAARRCFGDAQPIHYWQAK